MPAGAARRPAAPAPRQQATAAASAMTPAAARARQLAAQAEHRRAVAEFRARRAADQQARTNVLLLEAIAALAGLTGVQPVTLQPPPVPLRPIQAAPRGCLPVTGRAQILTGALAGLELGAWDRRILHRLAGWDTSTVLTVASWITRARVSATASRQPQP